MCGVQATTETPSADKRPRHLQRDCKICSAVIDPREDVAVQIDHGSTHNTRSRYTKTYTDIGPLAASLAKNKSAM